MAWQTPKTNWAGGNVPGADDFNRIERNTAELYEGKEPRFSKNSGFNLNKSDSVASTSSSVLATSKAVKTAYDKGVSAYNVAVTKEPKLAADRKRKITISPSNPSGGSDGDIWIKYL